MHTLEVKMKPVELVINTGANHCQRVEPLLGPKSARPDSKLTSKAAPTKPVASVTSTMQPLTAP